VVTEIAVQREERRFQGKLEALNYAIGRLAVYGACACVTVTDAGGIVFDREQVRRTFETLKH
jgi:uncharacterized protein YlxW (UPF0749 family)